MSGMVGSVAAQLLVLRKRAATWVLLGIWTALASAFGYIVPYVLFRSDETPQGVEGLRQLMPDRFVGNLSGGFPFYGGAIALMLGVLAVGSEFGWGTFKTLFTQGPGRVHVFLAKIIALAIALIPFVVVIFGVGAMLSAFIANQESAAIDWPSLGTIARGLFANWLIMLVWMSFGVLLAVASRGTSLAIGVGILYSLVIEGLVSALVGSVDFLEPLVKLFVRANAYSLVEPLGATAAGSAEDGPGRFAGPFVGGEQAFVMLVVYIAIFVGLSALMLRRRDVA